MAIFATRFRLRRDHSLEVNISDEERQLVAGLLRQLKDLLMGTSPAGDVDPSVRRLFPAAYPDDDALDKEYQELMRDQLLARRLDNIDLVESSLGLDRLSPEQAMGWIAAINDVRLVLGTRLDVVEDEEITDLDPDDPDNAAKGIYHYLGHLLGEIVDTVNP